MKPTRLSLLLFFISALYASGQSFDFSDSSIMARMHSNLAFLADDALKGRESGSPEELMAAHYIIDEFKKAGLKPGNGDSYLQPFVFFKKTKIAKYTVSWGNLSQDAYSLTPTSYSASGKVNGKTVIISEPEDISPDIKGKIVILFLESKNPDIGVLTKDKYWFADFLHKIDSLGPKAIILQKNFPEGYRPDFYAFGRPIDTLQIPVIYNYQEMDLPALEAYPDSINIQLNISRSEADTAYNIVGVIDNQAAESVVIGAHYDHIGLGYWGSRDKEMAGYPHNGADDNASGTVTIMELARFIKQNGLNDYNYTFVAFSAEERGLFGSWYFCRQNYGKQKVNYMFNFDMVGRMRKLRDKLVVLGTGTSDIFKPMLRKASYKGRLSFFPDAWEASDHWYFYEQKIPFLYFTTGLHKDYHKAADDTEKINFDGMLKTLKLTENMIVRLDAMAPVKYKQPRKASFLRYVAMFIP